MKTRLGVIYGSRSVEHEVSIITAVQLMKHIDTTTYEVVPLYIDKKGKWWTGETLVSLDAYKQDLTNPTGFTPYVLQPDPTGDHGIDVALICCHGTLGEDGTVQGLLELAGIPYQGPGVVGSALAMDKIMTKLVLRAAGIPVVNFQWYTATQWNANAQAVIDRILDPSVPDVEQVQFPLFVKPANLGSSVGITKATDAASLREAITIAFSFDRRVIIEQGIEGMKEINVSVLGYRSYEASTPEEPVASGDLLSYADKYEGGGKKTGGMASLKRRIPAPIPMSFTKKLQEAAVQIAGICDVSGVIRIDFITKPETGEYWANELNTIPGSMAFYLWEASGVPYTQLIDRLVQIARDRQADIASRITSIQTTIVK